MVKRLIVILIVGVVVVVGAIVFKQGERQELGERIQADFMGQLSEMDGWDIHSMYIEQAVGEFHLLVYEQSFVEHEGLTGGVVSEDLYERMMLGRLIRRAESDDQADLAGAIFLFCEENNVEPIGPN